MLLATTVTSEDELTQILFLQQGNLGNALSAEDIQSDGFVTLSYTIDSLKQMHALSPSVIIKTGSSVVAYALVVPKEGRKVFPPLEPMFQHLEDIIYQDQPLTARPFYIMGQICIAKGYRGKGLFDLLYLKHKELFQHRYPFVLTDISIRNQRSLRAHHRIGFKTIKTYRDELDEWAVVLWDWR